MAGAKSIKLPIRSYRIDQWFGSGMPSYVQEGYHTRESSSPPEHIGLVAIHCWNYGDEDGNYPIVSPVADPDRAKGWIDTAQHIMSNFIKPTFEAARKVGIQIFHAASTNEYADKYESYVKLASDPTITKTPPVPEGSVRPFSYEERMDAFAGPG